MIKTCAILATYNEADIVEESVKKLIAGGAEVFVFDNGSTDRTVEILAPMVGRGVIDIQALKFHEDGREVFNLSSILRTKESLSKKLGFDWYLNVDADEIRYSPWPHLSLCEGLDRVDRSGYNMVNFKLFNFRLSQDIDHSDDYERDMPHYSASEYFNQYQVKAWKAHPDIDITGYGGHIMRRPDARIYPVRFVHKHYPVRSLEHGRRKILQERKHRFSTSEKQRGWHLQYDHLDDVSPEDVFWSPDKLAAFEMQRECLNLLEEGADVACNLLSSVNIDALDAQIEQALLQRFCPVPFTPEHARRLLAVSRQLMTMARTGVPPAVESAPDDIEFMRRALQLMASGHWLTGDASIFQRIAAIALKVSQ